MIARSLAALGICGAALGAALAMQIASHLDVQESTRTSNTAQPLVSAPGVEESSPTWMEDVLARPMFSADRRPVASVLRAQTAAELPRLSGIIVSPTRSTAIFSGADSSKPMVVMVGARIGAFTVRTIAAGEVSVVSDAGTLVLRPSFSVQNKTPEQTPPPLPATAASLPPLKLDPTRPFDLERGPSGGFVVRRTGGLPVAPR